eukprot:27061_1
MASKLIFECTASEDVYDLLEPLLFGVPKNERQMLEDEFSSQGINGESLLFFDAECLEELSITEKQSQSIILKAINTLYSPNVLSKYLDTFASFNAAMIGSSVLDSQIDLNTLKGKGHEPSFYKNILNIQNEETISEFRRTFHMLFTHKPSFASREHTPSRSATTLPKLDTASSADIKEMKRSIQQYTSVLGALREATDAKQVLGLIEALSTLDANKMKTEMYHIPATQILHKIMYHETSIAKKEKTKQQQQQAKSDAEEEITNPILNYMATHNITSTLGTSLLCNEGVTLKELQLFQHNLRQNKQLTVNDASGVADSQSLLQMCHRIVKSYRRQSVETIAFLVIDVDSFYAINNEYDMKTGDELLIQIGEALIESIDRIHSNKMKEKAMSSCEFYHCGKNRFYVLLSVSSVDEAMSDGQIIVDMMRKRRFDVLGHALKRTVSVGVYIYNPCISINNIKSNAHIPLYYAKHNGKNQVISYSQIKALQSKQMSGAMWHNVWNKQMYDLVSVYGKYQKNLCKTLTKRLIVNKKCDINWMNKKDGNNTILMLCLENQYQELTNYYLTNFIHKLDFNLSRDDGSNALLLSIKYDANKQIVEKILYKTDSKNRNVTNKWHDNTLSLARIKG